ncbi:hypothetical protein XBJ1_2022 [Xenorhabdus bovienii SS-2004]|uniref:Uncharacterized protein n=1 Tax=Xenorhabdus bovienii (strain SS-2004) TaxID=406818 RepID=D3V333_XENBS|nr:hypothetical protein XBJ1_2022 [Xenorhabdus bovienii SS-2004]
MAQAVFQKALQIDARLYRSAVVSPESTARGQAQFRSCFRARSQPVAPKMAVSSGCGTELRGSLGLSMKKQPSENDYQSGEKPKNWQSRKVLNMYPPIFFG